MEQSPKPRQRAAKRPIDIDPAFAKALTETRAILLNMSVSERKRIPMTFVKFMHRAMDRTWQGNLDLSKPLNEMDLLPETRILLSLIYRDFLCSEEERKALIAQDQKKAQAEGWEFHDVSLMDMFGITENT